MHQLERPTHPMHVFFVRAIATWPVEVLADVRGSLINGDINSDAFSKIACGYLPEKI